MNHSLICLLDREAPGLPGPVVAVVDGRSKPPRTAMREEEYTAVRRLGSTCLASRPRRIAIRYRGLRRIGAEISGQGPEVSGFRG